MTDMRVLRRRQVSDGRVDFVRYSDGFYQIRYRKGNETYQFPTLDAISPEELLPVYTGIKNLNDMKKLMKRGFE